MKSIYVLTTDTNREYFSSLENLSKIVNKDLSLSDFEETEQEECVFYIYSDVDSDLYIARYDFEEDEDISFMECTGPSSECCFLIKNSSFDFYNEMIYYFNDVKKNTYEKGDSICFENKSTNNYQCLTYVYKHDNQYTDAMSFSFINNIICK
jgi:hypothetical protein